MNLFKIGNKYTAIYDIRRDREKNFFFKGLIKKYRIYFVLFLLYLITIFIRE